MQGKIIRGIGGFYYVHTYQGVYECRARGIFRKDKEKPLPGDLVSISVLDETEKKGNLDEILPRTNSLIRPAVANVDQALVIFALVSPKPNFNLLDRFLVLMEKQGIPAPDLIELPSVGTAKEFDLEGCAALSPDLVILPLKLKDAAASLTELGIPVLLVNPESQELLTEMIELVSTATNTQERANELLSYIASQKSMLSDTLADTEPKSVYLAGNSSLLSTAGPAMYQSSMIELAGGKNAAEEITDTYWAEISYEQLLAWDPAYIILASDADYTVDDILNDENLKDCTAVKNGQVYQIPGDVEALDSPVPASILASVWLAGILHPEQIPADTYTTESNTYYETFYGISNEN